MRSIFDDNKARKFYTERIHVKPETPNESDVLDKIRKTVAGLTVTIAVLVSLNTQPASKHVDTFQQPINKSVMIDEGRASDLVFAALGEIDIKGSLEMVNKVKKDFRDFASTDDYKEVRKILRQSNTPEHYVDTLIIRSIYNYHTGEGPFSELRQLGKEDFIKVSASIYSSLINLEVGHIKDGKQDFVVSGTGAMGVFQLTTLTTAEALLQKALKNPSYTDLADNKLKGKSIDEAVDMLGDETRMSNNEKKQLKNFLHLVYHKFSTNKTLKEQNNYGKHSKEKHQIISDEGLKNIVLNLAYSFTHSKSLDSGIGAIVDLMMRIMISKSKYGVTKKIASKFIDMGIPETIAFVGATLENYNGGNEEITRNIKIYNDFKVMFGEKTANKMLDYLDVKIEGGKLKGKEKALYALGGMVHFIKNTHDLEVLSGITRKSGEIFGITGDTIRDTMGRNNVGRLTSP